VGDTARRADGGDKINDPVSPVDQCENPVAETGENSQTPGAMGAVGGPA
tara:strand:+ start:549 stop:695 length:147 start_codon:yes stop_codon:yes gene_type:complete